MGIFKRILSTAVSAACALTLVFGSAAVPFAYPEIKAEAVASSSEYRDKIERIVELVNEERAKDGVAPVTLNETLTDAAMLRAEEITEQFSHTRPDNTSCFTVLKDYNIGYYACAENIAAGNSTADATMNQWVNSSGHYNNLMNATYTEIGVGVVYAPDSEYGYYWVQLFIKPTNPVQTTTAVTANTTTWATTLNTVKTTTSTLESHTSYTETTTTTTTTTTTKATTTSAWITTPATKPTYRYGDLIYRINYSDGYAEIVDCDSSAEGTVVIPSAVTRYGTEYPVEEIGQNAFSYCKNITEVDIPDSVTEIGIYAFDYCTSLTDVNIPNSVTEIGIYAFYKCSGLTDVNIPESVKYIREGAFGACINLKSITINNPECYISGERSTISNIWDNDTGTYYFYGTIYGYTGSTAQKYTANKSSYTFKALDEPEVTRTSATTNITTTYTTITTDVTETESQPPVTSRTTYEVSATETTRTSPRATTSATTSTWLATSSSAEPTYRYGDLRYRINNSNGYAEIVDCDSSAEGTVVIPSAVTCYGTEYPVEKIGQYAFYYCKNITEVDIPDSVTEIGDSAFSMCTSLTDVNIPNSVTEIGDRAFSGCTSLTEVVIPDSVTEIGESAFARCTSLTEVVIPDSVTEIERWAFSMCTSLTDVNIPENVKYIRDGAFERCSNLKSITINNPDCYISGKRSTISNERYTDAGIDDYYYFYGTIYGYTGSTAQKYAANKSYTFKALDEPEFTTTAVTTDITTTYTTVTTDVTETESQPPVTTTTTETSFIIITRTTTMATSIPGVMITSTSVSKSQSTGTVVTVTIPIISTVSSTVTSSDTTPASASTSATTTETITTYLICDLTSATSQTISSATSSVSVSGTTVSQTTQTTPEGDIRLSRTSLDMSVGDRILLKIFGYEGTVQWVYSDPKIALVDENGYVEAVGEGSTTVYAVYGNGILSCSVTVEGTGTSETNIGDANGDGKLDVRDAAYIARMLAGGQGDEIPLTADFNGDGQVNVRDAAAIARFLANAHQ